MSGSASLRNIGSQSKVPCKLGKLRGGGRYADKLRRGGLCFKRSHADAYPNNRNDPMRTGRMAYCCAYCGGLRVGEMEGNYPKRRIAPINTGRGSMHGGRFGDTDT